MAGDGDSALSELMCQNWETSGRNEFVGLYKTIFSMAQDETLFECGSNTDVKRMIYELCWSVLHSHLTYEQVVAVLPDLIAVQVETAPILADVLTIIELEVQLSTDEAVKETFTQLQNACLSVIPKIILKEKLDLDCTSGIEVVNKSTQFLQTETYASDRQQKFSVLHEENEGYSKLICELNKPLDPTEDVVYLVDIYKSLIGCFNLNPDRVLRIILESFEIRISESKFFIPLLKAYTCDENTLCKMLALKFKVNQDLADFESTETLYTIAGLLIGYQVISPQGIYHYLTPGDDNIKDENQKLMDDAKSYARSLCSVLTADKNVVEEGEDTTANQYQLNQKLRLCETLLRMSDWKHARQIIDLLPRYYASSWSPIGSIICKMLHITMDPLYRKYVFDGPSNICVEELNKEFAPEPLECFSDFRDSVLPMICSLGLYLHRDPILMFKIARITKAYLILHPLEVPGLEFDIITILDEALLPSLSLLDCNCCMAEELWNLIQLYPYQYRNRLYGLWKNNTLADHHLIIRRRADCNKKIKYIMKRLSTENVAQSGRQIGKLSHSNPGCLFEYILAQIQNWDNLIIPVVDSLKYLTNLSYDVLSYCIVEALGDPEKVKMSHDGTSISLWLQSLSIFCGAVYSKYSIELSGLLQYVANQLKAEESVDLIILKEIIYKMSGIETVDDITDDQVVALTGGEILNYCGGSFNPIKNTKRSSEKLKDALLELDLVIPLYLLMAQQRQCILYKEREKSHMKLVGKLYDQCQNTLVQFGSFLAKNFDADEIICLLPPLDSLLGDFRISADAAFFLYRPVFNNKIVSTFLEMEANDRSYKSASADAKIKKYLDVVFEVMRCSVEDVHKHLPLQVWDTFSPQFYVTFWALKTYDICVPRGSYEQERNKLDELIVQTKNNRELSGLRKQTDLINHYQLLKRRLGEEEKRQTDHSGRVALRLRNEKDSWFLSKGAAKNEMLSNFLQLCIFPRCVYAPMDAVYCAQFVRTIHDFRALNFPTINCYDRIFSDITLWGKTCTENEASCYGRFLCVALATVHHWHSSKEVFQKECWKHPGFVTKLDDPGASPGSVNLDYETFRHLCYAWHCSITKALIVSLESGDYLQIRNTFIILTKILPWFPYLLNLLSAIEKRVETVMKKEKNKRPDLYALATGYSGQLKSMKPSMIPQKQFHQMQKKTGACAASPESNPPNMSPGTKGKALDVAENNLSDCLQELKDMSPAVVPKEQVHEKLINIKVDAVSAKSTNVPLTGEDNSLDIQGDHLPNSSSGQLKGVEVSTSPEPEIHSKQMEVAAPEKCNPDFAGNSKLSNIAQAIEGTLLEIAGDDLPSCLEQLISATPSTTPEPDIHPQMEVAAPAKCNTDLEENSKLSDTAQANERTLLDIAGDDLPSSSGQLKRVKPSTTPEPEIHPKQMKTAVGAKSKLNLEAIWNTSNVTQAAKEKSLDVIPNDNLPSYAEKLKAFKFCKRLQPEIHPKQMETVASTKSNPDSESKWISSNVAPAAEEKSFGIPKDNTSGYSEEFNTGSTTLSIIQEQEIHKIHVETTTAAAPKSNFDSEAELISSNMTQMTERKLLGIPENNTSGYSEELNSTTLSIIQEQEIHKIYVETTNAAAPKSNSDSEAELISSNMTHLTEGKLLDFPDDNIPGYSEKLENTTPSINQEQEIHEIQVKMTTAVASKSNLDLEEKSNSSNVLQAAEGQSPNIPGDNLISSVPEQLKNFKFSKISEQELHKEPVKMKTAAAPALAPAQQSNPDLEAKSNSSNLSQAAERKSLDIPGDNLPSYSEELHSTTLSKVPEQGLHKIRVKMNTKFNFDLKAKSNSSNLVKAAGGKAISINKSSVWTSAFANVGVSSKPKPSNSNASMDDLYQFFSKIQLKIPESSKITKAISTAGLGEGASTGTVTETSKTKEVNSLDKSEESKQMNNGSTNSSKAELEPGSRECGSTSV